MGRTKAYENTLKAIAQVKQGIGNFELFLRKAIAESEGEPTCSPEACNDPDNCVHGKTATAGDIYQSCVEFAEKNGDAMSGEVMKMMLGLLSENIKAEDRNEVNEVLKFAQSKGFHAVKGISDIGEEIVVIFQI